MHENWKTETAKNSLDETKLKYAFQEYIYCITKARKANGC